MKFDIFKRKKKLFHSNIIELEYCVVCYSLFLYVFFAHHGSEIQLIKKIFYQWDYKLFLLPHTADYDVYGFFVVVRLLILRLGECRPGGRVKLNASNVQTSNEILGWDLELLRKSVSRLDYPKSRLNLSLLQSSFQ